MTSDVIFGFSFQGIFVGYRSYEIKDICPLFPFGYGLSYTTFQYSELKTSSVTADGRFVVTFTVKNTGRVSGREVAQVYISDPHSSLPRPVKELKGFVKIDLDPGCSKTATCQLDREALSFYDGSHTAWIAEAGKFDILVASSSRPVDIKLKGQVELANSFFWTGL
jgi:beta-glucosidase